MTARPYSKPLPQPDPDTQGFWDGCKAHELWIRAEHVTETLDARNRARLSSAALVLDCLDNAPSRALLTGLAVPALHVGVSETGSGSCLWESHGYQVPEDGHARGQNPVCTHRLSAQLLRMTATAAVGVIEDWLANRTQRSALVTARQVV